MKPDFENRKVLVQGITGREAREKVPEMQEYGTEIVAGVTPGKEGQEVNGIPVYNTVKKAKKEHPEINTSIIYVPAFAAKDATIEAIKNNISLINIITENIPIKDTWEIKKEAKKAKTTIIGPTSVGILNTYEKVKIGPIGGSKPEKSYKKGKIGIVSKNGGKTKETAHMLKQQGYGISTAIDIGGDRIALTNFSETLRYFEQDPNTEAVVMFGEQGGTYENQTTKLLKNNEFTKPLITFIAGEFTEKMPSKQFGHAGAIIRQNQDKPSQKKKELREAGAHVADIHHKIGKKLDKIL